MSLEFRALISTLKQALKARQITYRRVADHLGVSEQTIKRLFSSTDGPVGRLVEICDFIGVPFYELVRLTADEAERVFRLTETQEAEFCRNPADYAYFDQLVHHGQTAAEIREAYGLGRADEAEIKRRLERMGLIDVSEKGCIRLRVQGTHNWLHGGPLQRRFLFETTAHFIQEVGALDSMVSARHLHTTAERKMTEGSLKECVAETRDLFARFRRIAQREESLLAKRELLDVRWVACIARFPPAFEPFLRRLGRRV